MVDEFLWNVGVTLVFLGFVLSFIVALLLVLSGMKGGKGRVRGGGVVIIGPIPIIFGTDKQSVKVILILSIVLVALLIVLTLFSLGVFQ